MRTSDRRPLSLLIPFAIAALLSACSGEPETSPVASTSCPANTAMFAVGDGYLQTICGCAEASPVYTGPGTRLVCTVPTGTLIMVQYLGTTLTHQIVPTSVATFPASPPSDPRRDEARTFRVHVFRLSTAGTYSFQDQFNTGLAGDLIVL